jgi:hypothetical protein
MQIENELGAQWSGTPSLKVPDSAIDEYMELLEASARAAGIDVPLSANAPNMVRDSPGSNKNDTDSYRILFHGRKTFRMHREMSML